ncbi:MAG: cell envelope integrity protein CreD [Flavisolibacter sp.]
MNIEITANNIVSGGKLLIKSLIIGLIVLILLLPTFSVESLIKEREQRQREAITEVSSKWAGNQNISGPVIVLPYWETDSLQKLRYKHYAYFLPDDLTINSEILPQQKYRGIYKVMLYSTNVNMSGSYTEIKPEKLSIAPESILWNEAFIKINLGDIKGLNDELKMNWNDRVLSFTSQASESKNSADGLVAPLNITSPNDLKNIKFSGNMNLNGSEKILFTPVGKSTTVKVHSTWPHPSFTGIILPQVSSINNSGFSATWRSLAHKRRFPQEWKDDAFYINPAMAFQDNTGNNIINGSFGADLFIPVNAYQQTMRSVKYAVLCILLTFAAFFLIETTNKKFIHPFQYGLIGLALVLFYTLLLSFSEYIGFNYAYLVSSIATIGLIGWFVRSILTSSRLSILLAFILTIIYGYIFTILQLQDYSLLLGSIGLFITLAIIMHFSKKIQW